MILSLTACSLTHSPDKVTTSAIVYVSSVAHESPDGTEERPFPTISQALAVPADQLVVRVGPGVYEEAVRLRDKRVLEAWTGERPVIRVPDWSVPVVTMSGESSISGMVLDGGSAGVLVSGKADVRITETRMINGYEGVWFDTQGGHVAIDRVEILNVEADAIDLEGQTGTISNSTIIGSGDDAIDFDGNANVTVFGNSLLDSHDDGIEIRLLEKTVAHIYDNVISGNGEDGIEIIQSPKSPPQENSVRIHDNEIRENSRYGIGCVSVSTEEADVSLPDEIEIADNAFQGNVQGDVTPTCS